MASEVAENINLEVENYLLNIVPQCITNDIKNACSRASNELMSTRISVIS